MLGDAIGFSALALALLLVGALARRHRSIALPLLVAFLLRAGWALFHRYVAPLPDSGADAVMFEKMAWEWTSGGWSSILGHWQGGAWLYPWLIAVLYAVVGRSVVMIQALNVLCGVGIVCVSSRIAETCFHHRAAKPTAWIAALFPTLNLYSAITLREAPLLLFALLGVLYAARWQKSDRILNFLLATVYLAVAVGFHTGVWALWGVLGVWSMARVINRCLHRLRPEASRAVAAVVMFAGLTALMISSGWGLEKFGLFGHGVGTQQALYAVGTQQALYAQGRAAYLRELTVRQPWDVLWQLPIRVVFFLLTPFPWQVEVPADLLGLLDAAFYAVLGGWCLWGLLTRRLGGRCAGLLTAFLVAGISVFAMTTSNYGAAIRHRAKFAPLLAVLAVGATVARRSDSRPGGESKQCLRSRRVALVSTGLAYGGAETQVVHLARGLKRRGWDVLVVSVLSPRAYQDELEREGIAVVSLGVRAKVADPRPLLRLIRLLRAWRPHIVHAHMVHANLLARVARLLAPVPVVVCTAHSIYEKGKRGSGRWREFLYRVTDPFCDLSTQVSKAGLERYIRVGAFRLGKARYIPNGVDTKRFRPDPGARAKLRAELGVGNAFVWLAVGRFEPQKDYPTMLRAFAIVARERPDAVLVIVGDGPLRPEIEELAVRLGIAQRVQFLGIRRDVPSLMNVADAYLLSSVYEGMPMVLLEAHAVGLPVVATEVGGNKEVVLDRVTGYLVPAQNPQALARAVAQVMNMSPEERRRMGDAGRRHVEERFSLDRVVELWETLYTDLLAQKGVSLG